MISMLILFIVIPVLVAVIDVIQRQRKINKLALDTQRLRVLLGKRRILEQCLRSHKDNAGLQ